MKRRLITGVYLSLAALAACQAEPDGDTDMVSQAATASCGADLPPTPFWTGERLPPTGPTEIYLAYADLDRPGEWVMVRVDYGKGVIVSGVRTKTSTFGSLLGKLDEAAQYAVGRQPTPPQPVDEWSLSQALIALAKVTAPDLKAAELAGECKAASPTH